jgi:hypothetical protein
MIGWGGREERGSGQGKEIRRRRYRRRFGDRTAAQASVAGSRRNGRFLREAANLVLASRFLPFCFLFLVGFFSSSSLPLLVSRASFGRFYGEQCCWSRRGCPCDRASVEEEEGETNLRRMRDAWRHEDRLMVVG